MNTTELSNIRGYIVEKFTNIEMGISIFISKSYFGKANNDFIYEILYDELMSFGIRRSIFETLLKKKNLLKDFPMEDLRELGKIRNIFAHSWKSSPDDKNFHLMKSPNKTTKDVIPNIKSSYDENELVKKFDTLYEKVQTDKIFSLITQ